MGILQRLIERDPSARLGSGPTDVEEVGAAAATVVVVVVIVIVVVVT
jgi:hypothetical protein